MRWHARAYSYQGPSTMFTFENGAVFTLENKGTLCHEPGSHCWNDAFLSPLYPSMNLSDCFR